MSGLSEAQKEMVRTVVSDALDKAERDWGQHGTSLTESVFAAADSDILTKSEIQPSRIPSHPFVSGDKPELDDFVALVADIRNSTEHLRSVSKATKVEKLQRVYYETSALLPAVEKTILFEGGSVTEYLGDGILALFKIPEGDAANTIKSAYLAAENCINDTRNIVNKELEERYLLPALNIGVGLGFSKALVSLVGIGGNRHAKVIGECVYRATKLSAGHNQIVVDEAIYHTWPTTNAGKLKFRSKTLRETTGYAVHRSE